MRSISTLNAIALLSFALIVPCLGTAQAQASAAPNDGASPLRLRIVGGLAGLNQFTRHEEPFWTRDLPRLSGRRATAEIVPFDRAGIRGQEMLRLVQLGAVPFGTTILGLTATEVPELSAPDLAGLNPDIETARRTLSAFRPYLESLLRDRFGVEVLALYVYPAQVTFCTKALTGLADLNGRRVRVSNSSQADMVTALGGTPVQTGFTEIVSNVRNGNIDCAITGTMSGNAIGLHQVTHFIHALPIAWGVAAFIANGSAWNALPADLRAILRKELPVLEQAIWAESARETGEGIACNAGTSACITGRKGTMTVVAATPADERRRVELLTSKILPGWIERCGPQCVKVWQSTIGPVSGITLR